MFRFYSYAIFREHMNSYLQKLQLQTVTPKHVVAVLMYILMLFFKTTH